MHSGAMQHILTCCMMSVLMAEKKLPFTLMTPHLGWLLCADSAQARSSSASEASFSPPIATSAWPQK